MNGRKRCVLLTWLVAGVVCGALVASVAHAAAPYVPGVPHSNPHVFRVPEWGNATIVEIAWMLLGLLGVTVATTAAVFVGRDHRLFDSDTARREFTTKRRRAMRRVWRGALYRELGRVYLNSIVLGLGLWACVQPSLTHPTVTTTTGLVITFLIFNWIAITIAQSVWDFITRRAVVEVLDEDDEPA